MRSCSLEQAFCVYLACLARRYSSRSVINPTHQKLTKKDRGFFAGKLEPVRAKRQAQDFDSSHFSCL
jgi:hypothetical protein